MAPAVGSQSPTSATAKPVGAGNDYSAKVTGTISQATGSFDLVRPGITETGQVGGQGGQVADTFTLQLNSQFFSTLACANSSDPSKCKGWQQFVYETSTNSVFMQYWLINYSASCPSNWITFNSDCYTNSPAATYAGSALTAADLPTTDLVGSATSGGNDQVTVSSGTSGQASDVTSPDNVVDLAKKWNTAEFGVFGDGGGSEANFGPQTRLEAQTTLASTSTGAPTCVKKGFTAETNNLSLTQTPSIATQSAPTIVSRQTNQGAKNESCATTAGDGYVNYVTTQPAYETGPNFLCTGALNSGIDCTGDTIIQFAAPVSKLSFDALGVNDTGQVADFDLWGQNGLIATVPEVGNASGFNAERQDLTSYKGVTALVIYNITDGGGIGWNNFKFVQAGKKTTINFNALPQDGITGIVVTNQFPSADFTASAASTTDPYPGQVPLGRNHRAVATEHSPRPGTGGRHHDTLHNEHQFPPNATSPG
jgi:hypothetical protein